MSSENHPYQLHGLTLSSELRFPELAQAAAHEVPDVVVRFGPTPETLGAVRRRSVCFEANPLEFLIAKAGAARFLVRDGREVVIDLAPGADPAEVRRLFLAAPLAALLLQRGLLALQASMVATPGGAIGFLAGSCLGKSTLALEFVHRGCALISDEIAAVRLDAGGAASVLPGHSTLKLWPDSLTGLGLDPQRFPRVRPELEKRAVRCDEAFDPRPRRLRRLYVLRREEALPGGELTAHIAGSERAAVLMNHIYLPVFMVGLDVQAAVLRQITGLVRDVPVVRVIQPGGRLAPREVADAIQQDLAR